eukprot:scaffold131625_cov38-Prasinocladus_malaysianus.AAC.1
MLAMMYSRASPCSSPGLDCSATQGYELALFLTRKVVTWDKTGWPWPNTEEGFLAMGRQMGLALFEFYKLKKAASKGERRNDEAACMLRIGPAHNGFGAFLRAI